MQQLDIVGILASLGTLIAAFAAWRQASSDSKKNREAVKEHDDTVGTILSFIQDLRDDNERLRMENDRLLLENKRLRSLLRKKIRGSI